MDFEKLSTQLVSFCRETLRQNMFVSAEDIAQEVLIDLLSQTDVPEERALAWCFKRCWSRMGHHNRRLKRFPYEPFVTDDHTQPVAINEPSVTDPPVDDTPIEAQLESLLGELRGFDEVVMRLSLLGLDPIQIANVLAKARGTVRSSLSRARESLGLPFVEAHLEVSPRLMELLTDAQVVLVRSLIDPTPKALVA